MIHLFPVDEVCLVFLMACLDKNNFVWDIILCIFKREGDACEILDLSIRGELLRLANVLVYEWAAGKHACLNLTEVFPLVEFMIVSLL
jgi:hypothetical protein